LIVRIIIAIIDNQINNRLVDLAGAKKGNNMTDTPQDQSSLPSETSEPLEVDTVKISSPVLARLIEEVRQEEQAATTVYNRVHNRHNRGR